MNWRPGWGRGRGVWGVQLRAAAVSHSTGWPGREQATWSAWQEVLASGKSWRERGHVTSTHHQLSQISLERRQPAPGSFPHFPKAPGEISPPVGAVIQEDGWQIHRLIWPIRPGSGAQSSEPRAHRRTSPLMKSTCITEFNTKTTSEMELVYSVCNYSTYVSSLFLRTESKDVSQTRGMGKGINAGRPPPVGGGMWPDASQEMGRGPVGTLMTMWSE